MPQLAERHAWPEATATLRELRRQEAFSRECYGERSNRFAAARERLETAEAEILTAQEDVKGTAKYLDQLRLDLEEVRAVRPGSGLALDAWNLYFNEHERLGRSLTQLERYSPEEDVRFFARVVHGVEDHAYWTGGGDFRRNHGGIQKPARWWWEHHYEVDLTIKVVLWAECGEKACINPLHLVLGDRGNQMRYEKGEILKRLQVWTLQRGEVPSQKQWEKSGGSPTAWTVRHHFGNWENAVREAGLTPKLKVEFTAAECLAAIRFLRHELGHWPTWGEYRENRELLKQKGMPASFQSHTRHFGTYVKARNTARRTR